MIKNQLGGRVKIKAKYVLVTGAFIVLTIIGYILLPKDEIMIDLESGKGSLDFESYSSGDIKSENVIYVHIEGAINSPGIKVVSEGTRLFELIELSGGELQEADLSKVNLASILRDEQKVYIPYKIISDETNNENYSERNAMTNLININTATSEELQRLDGIGSSMASKILDYREANGYFSDIEELKNVSGIGESKYNKIKDSITI